MNKSKFLKRSLATLLAILLVVAMVPMSAFAAEPDVIKVQGVEAELSGDAYTVSISAPNGTAAVIENALKNVSFELRSKNGISVGILDKDGKQKDVDLIGWPDEPGTKQTINLLDYAVKPEGTYWGDYTGMKLRITPKTGDPVEYPLTITVSERNASSDTTITAVESTRIVGANVDMAKHHIEIIKPVGADSDAETLGLEEGNFKRNNPYATIDFTYGGTSGKVIILATVTAEDKSTQKYTVSYKVEPIFTEFKLKDINIIDYSEVEDGISAGQYDGNGNVNITVKVPYNAFEKDLVPTFTTSSKVIDIVSQATSFSHGDGVLFDIKRGSTSGVAVWAAANTNETNNEGTTVPGQKFTFDVETEVSSLKADTGSYDSTGEAVVTFMPVKNTEAKLTGVNVGDKSGNPTYSQGLIEIPNGTINRNIIVGEIPAKNILDVDDKDATADVVALTTRDIELQVSDNAKVTILNPNGLIAADGSIYDDDDDTNFSYDTTNGRVTPVVKETGAATASGDGIVLLNDVNLRKYHSTPMRVLVTSEDGANKTEYRLTFKGTPTGKPEITSITLHSSAGDVTSTKDKNGNIILHVPYGSKLDGTNNLATAYSGTTIKASDGAMVYGINGLDVHGSAPFTERDTSIDAYAFKGNGVGAPVNIPAGPSGTKYSAKLHVSYTDNSCTAGDSKCETTTYLYVIVDSAKTTANITDITLTAKNELVDAVGNKLPGTVNPNNKTIRLDVPYDFNRNDDGTPKANTDLYLYDWAFNGIATADITGGIAVAKRIDANTIKYDFADLGKQTDTTSGSHTKHEAIVRLTEKEITSIADLSKFTPSRASDNKNVIRVWSEKTYLVDSDNKGTQEYIVYAVRQNASSESKLNNVTASAPVSVVKDTSVEKLNRFIITVPKNYNSTTGINDAKEFELNFSDRSKNSTVENGQTVWANKGEDTVKFKVADSKLYFKDNEANLTDGRVIHFTIRAEDRTSTGAYEFIIREGEASKNAALSSVAVDDKVSFTKDGSSFIVQDLSENENYDVTKLPVIITTEDPGATVTVDGKAYIPEHTTVDLSEGKTAEVVVTAADEVTTATYTLSMRDGSAPVDRPSDSYTDLDKVYSGHLERVKYAIDNGLMSNDGKPGVFNSEGKIARRDFALIIARANMRLANPDAEDIDALLKEKYAGKEDAFNDIAKLNDTQKAAIAYCKEIGIVEGNGQNGFNPSGAVSREDAAIMIAKWCELEAADNGNTNNIKDWNNVHNWAKAYVNAVYEAKLMNGTGNDNFTPARNLNRGEAAYIIVGVLETKAPSAD